MFKVLCPYTSQRVTATTSSAATAFPATGSGQIARFANLGSNIVYLALGGAGVVATNANIALLPGAIELFDRSPESFGPVPNTNMGPTHFALLAETASTDINVVTGAGA